MAQEKIYFSSSLKKKDFLFWQNYLLYSECINFKVSNNEKDPFPFLIKKEMVFLRYAKFGIHHFQNKYDRLNIWNHISDKPETIFLEILKNTNPHVVIKNLYTFSKDFDLSNVDINFNSGMVLHGFLLTDGVTKKLLNYATNKKLYPYIENFIALSELSFHNFSSVNIKNQEFINLLKIQISQSKLIQISKNTLKNSNKTKIL